MCVTFNTNTHHNCINGICSDSSPPCIICPFQSTYVSKRRGADASVLHSQEILQVFFISSDQQAPSLLLCRDACGTIHIWSIREKAFLGRVDNMKPSTCSISQGVTSSGNSRGLIATQFKNKQQKGYLAFAVKDVFEFYSIQYSTVGDSTTSKSALSRSCVSMKRVLAINQVHSSMEPLALSFIHDNNRLCILASREDIVIIDCLQKCAIKKVETKSDSLRNELSGPIRAHIGRFEVRNNISKNVKV